MKKGVLSALFILVLMAAVNTEGLIVTIGCHADDAYVGVRPAMWIIF